jgi:5-methylcytosine-specific restriction endonuclease McrA
MTREEVKAYDAARYLQNRPRKLEQFREWKAKNRGRHRALSMRWQKEHPKESRAIKAAYKKRHPEKTRAGRIRTSTASLASHAAREGARRAKTQKPTPAVLEIYRLSASDVELTCHWCSAITTRAERHVDHVLPLSLGGSHEADNLAIACRRCNLTKGRLHPEVFVERRRVAI